MRTLGVVGVEHGASETARRTSNGRKVGAEVFATLERRSPHGRAERGSESEERGRRPWNSVN